MDAIFDLFNLILKIVFIGGGAIFIINMLRSSKFKNIKQEVEILQAKLSQYRLALRAKVKKKSQTFRVAFKTPVADGDQIDKVLVSLYENKFEQGEDFQNYFETSRKIVQFLKMDSGEVAATEENQAQNDNTFMSSDFKLEMDIVRLIKHMSDLSARIHESVQEYNSRTRKASAKIPSFEAIQFPALAEINRIFSGSESASAATAQDTKKAS